MGFGRDASIFSKIKLEHLEQISIKCGYYNFFYFKILF